MVAVDRIQGLSGSRAIKTPVRVATTTAITLSGEQTIDGVAVVEGDRVLVKDQASGVDNGIYEVSTGDWPRTLDFDGANDATRGTLLTVNEGSVNAGTIYKLATADPITIGTTSLSFSGSGIAPTLPLAINQGGTASTTASDARTALGAAASGANTDITALGGVTIGAAGLSSTVAMTADISPSQITANQNDYNPTGLSTASVLRLNSDASRDITGLQGGADGRLIVIHNVGSFNIVLKDESGASTAANRFALFADITLGVDQSVVLQYDSTSSRWRAVALPASATGGAAGDVQTFNSGGTWTKPASGTMALIEVWGAGGGGARRSSGNSTGGAGGGYTLLWKKLSDLGATETVTIGAGGLAQSTDSTSGNNGGVTSFGAHISHVGGTGGDQVAAASNTASPHAGGVGAVQGISTNTSARSGANSAAAITSAALTAYPMGTAGQPASVPAADAVCVTPLPCFMGGGCGGNVSTVLNAQSNGATSTYGGAGGNGNKAGSGSAGTQPGGGGGAGTTQGGAGGDGRVKVSVF